MTAHELPYRIRRKSRGVLVPLILFVALTAGAVAFVSYELWPTWPGAQVPLDAPAIPVTVAGVLFNVPPAAIRASVQRHPGTHDRIDLAFVWPSLTPPGAESKVTGNQLTGGADLLPGPDNRLFVTIAELGAVLPPAIRLRTIYPRYIEAQATAGADGLAVVAFRAGTPYEGEDLVYFADKPEQFFARCSRSSRGVPGTCIRELSLDAAEITLRFPRDWLKDWHSLAAGLDRLVAQLHPQAENAH
jgi:hypothetical protein